MKILSLAAAKPDQRFDNDGFLRALDHLQTRTGVPEERRRSLARRVRSLFGKAGTRERHVHYPPQPGYAAALLRQAATRALAESGLQAGEVDLVIYCSVARGWLEPSSAAAAQAMIGAGNASCFDVLEACAGWMRAVEVADSLFRAGRYRNAIILGVEAGLQDALVPPDPTVEYGEEHLAGFTLGEAATAMVVSASDAPAPEIVLKSDGSALDACMLPLPAIAAFTGPGQAPEPGRFLSHAVRLFTRVGQELYGVMKQRLAQRGHAEFDLFILHAASDRAGEVLRRALGIPAAKWLCTHADFGNNVAMSMPVALDHAYRTGRAKRGDRVCFLVGSAGITYGYGVLTV